MAIDPSGGRVLAWDALTWRAFQKPGPAWPGSAKLVVMDPKTAQTTVLAH